MSMVVNPRRLDDVVILDLSGRITIGEGTLILRDRIQKLLKGGDRKFLLNLADVDYIDSSGLGELVSSFTTVRNQEGTAPCHTFRGTVLQRKRSPIGTAQ